MRLQKTGIVALLQSSQNDGQHAAVFYERGVIFG